jgi:hypothetical protein
MCFDKDVALRILYQTIKNLFRIPGYITPLMTVTIIIGLLLAFGAMTDCVAIDSELTPADTTQIGAVAVESADRPAASSVTPSKVQEIEKTRAKVPEEPVRKKDNTAPGIGKQASPPPPLDLPSLEKRLRETKAIGVFTKITLKNQVDDLVNQFREYHRGRGKTTLAELRQRYDMLLLKLISLLQDNDPTLTRTIVASREAIWAILTDPDKFATI